jgi:hypothetical protein
MHPVSPATGAPEVILAKDQPEYLPLPAAVYLETEHGSNCRMYATRWTMTDEERLAVAEGSDIFVTQLVFDQPLPQGLHTPGRFAPIMVLVGAQWLKVTPEVGHGG